MATSDIIHASLTGRVIPNEQSWMDDGKVNELCVRYMKNSYKVRLLIGYISYTE
jgi:hypothetical protein